RRPCRTNWTFVGARLATALDGRDFDGAVKGQPTSEGGVPMKFNSSIAAAALVTLALGACKSETKNETVNADTTATAPVAAPAQPAPPPGPVTANLEAKDNS